MVSRLVDEGWVSMSIDPTDRRRRRLAITDAGRDKERELAPLVDEAARLVIDGLTDAEERQLLKLLNKAGASLQAPERASA